MTAEVIPAEVPADPTPRQLCALALKQGAGIDVIERFSALAERWEATEAKKTFAAAMNRCQANMPTVVRMKKNTQTNRMYAPVDDIQVTAEPIYSVEGFTLSFTCEAGNAPELTTVHLDVAHPCGHVQRSTLPNCPLDDKGPKGGDVKTKIQGLKSSLSYAKGILICMAFNITVADEDKDGSGSAALTDANRDKLTELWKAAEQACVDAGVPKSGWDKYAVWFLKWMEVEKLDDVHPAKFQSATLELVRKAREPK